MNNIKTAKKITFNDILGKEYGIDWGLCFL